MSSTACCLPQHTWDISVHVSAPTGSRASLAVSVPYSGPAGSRAGINDYSKKQAEFEIVGSGSESLP